uniref:uncharacterized protein LOC120888359 isoform X2 n=1 Tax=Ictidomys tridecemlineatus TaxID=43179 RepID=UPI001A9FB5E5|nr:uncharacterized protein LOC120888359 isoform X2 [Ictidomys tridecemlineatus]
MSSCGPVLRGHPGLRKALQSGLSRVWRRWVSRGSRTLRRFFSRTPEVRQDRTSQGCDRRSSLDVSSLVDSFTSLMCQELEKDLVNVLQRQHPSWVEELLCRRPKVTSIQKVLELLSQRYEEQQLCMEEVFLPGQNSICSAVQMWLYLYPEDFVGSMDSLRSLRTFLLHTMPESGLTVQVERLLTGLENTDPTASPGKTLN